MIFQDVSVNVAVTWIIICLYICFRLFYLEGKASTVSLFVNTNKMQMLLAVCENLQMR